MIHTSVRRAALLVACGGSGLALLAGCSSTSSNDATTTATPTHVTPSGVIPSRSAAPANDSPSGALSVLGECNEPSLLAALPEVSKVIKFQCEIASPWMWAAARVNGPRVFFLQTRGGAWRVSEADQVCGVPSKGVPKELLAFCPKV